jgi:hypothetical protein
MRHMADGPDHDGDGVTRPRAEFVDDAPEAEIAQRIGQLEPEDDGGIGVLIPAEFGLQRGLEHADHLPVDVIDSGGREQQSADHPAIAPGLARRGGSGRFGRRIGPAEDGLHRRIGGSLPLDGMRIGRCAVH